MSLYHFDCFGSKQTDPAGMVGLCFHDSTILNVLLKNKVPAGVVELLVRELDNCLPCCAFVLKTKKNAGIVGPVF